VNRNAFRKKLETILILDGATGTELQKQGLPPGESPDRWVLDHPEAMIALQRKYFEAGSDAVLSFTFGGNRIKLGEYGMAGNVREINRRLVEISRKAAGDTGLVGGDISGTGRFVAPFGDLPFEEAVDIFKEQVAGIAEGGADFLFIETMIDIQEARAALIAAKETCDLPVCVSMTFNEDGRTLTGTDPVSALVTLQSLGADAVGCNCSTGPAHMVEFLSAMKPYARVPLFAKPNAGLPKLVDGDTVFDMTARDFGEYVLPLVEAGAAMLGGCCGTDPDYIREVRQRLAEADPVSGEAPVFSAVSSARKTVQIGPDHPVTIIGERINPTGKKTLQAELKAGKTAEVRRFAMEQTAAGAAILDINVGMPGIDEGEKMVELVNLLSAVSDAPLCIDSSTPEVIEKALRVYPGRALINSISAEKKKVDALLPIAAKYGAMFILLPLGDDGIPKTAAKRAGLVEGVFEQARALGFEKQDIIVDGLVMTVSSDQRAALETLETVRWCSRTFGVNTVLGLSNVSFGLPQRTWVNNTFFAMAVANGLTTAIANPSSEGFMQLKMAADVLSGKDRHSGGYIAYCTGKEKPAAAGKTGAKEVREITEQIFDEVVAGNREVIGKLLEKALAEGHGANELMDRQLIPAITRVGELYEKKEYFLPQLIQSAEAMQQAFEILEPHLQKDTADAPKKAAIVLATVKGDIHDIGKNIVALMMKNYGFIVHDLGKDVDARTIVTRARETGAAVIGLSALMTTTMVQMKKVVDLARKEGLTSRIMIGGAVVNQAYADEIGADGYAPDAHMSVKLAQKLTAA
jgi:5-methyltetrahydrofolate--homocysteine methyltransferase